MSDQNKSKNNRGMNSAEDISSSSTSSEMERIGSKIREVTLQEKLLGERVKSKMNSLAGVVRAGIEIPEFREAPRYETLTRGFQSDIMKMRGEMNTIRMSSVERGESEYTTFLSRRFAPAHISSEAQRGQRLSSVQNQGLSLLNVPYDELASMKSSAYANINTLGNTAINQVRGMYSTSGEIDPQRKGMFLAAEKAARGYTSDIAAINTAQKMQTMLGVDPESKLEQMLGKGRAASIAREIQSGQVSITSGGVASKVNIGQDVDREIINQSRILADAFEKLTKGALGAGETLEGVRKQAEEAATNLDKLEKASGAGGGGMSRSQHASLWAGGFQAASGAAREILVSQRLGQVSNIAGYANIENQKYDMYKSARGGDVMSQMLLSQWGASQRFGKQLFMGQQTAVGLQVAGGTAQIAAGAFQAKDALNPIANVTGQASENVATGAVNMIQGTANVAVGTSDLLRKVSAGAAEIQGTQAQMEARKALLAIPAQQLQGFRDFSVGLGTAAQGMGAAGGAFVNGGMGGLENMVKARISPEQFNQMAQFGVQNMGSTFQSSQIFAARGLERSGYGSMQENMQRMSALASAGSNNPQAGLGSVMEAAFTRGLESSKAMSMLVENTAQMVQSTGASTAAGINTTAAAAMLLGSSIDPNQKNQEFAVQRAAVAQEVSKNTVTDTSVSFAGMLNTGRISNTTGLSGPRSIMAARLTTAEIRGLQAMGANEANEALLKRGINASGAKGGIEGFLNTMLVDQTTQMFTGNAALALGSNELRGSLTKKALAGRKWESLSPDEKELAGQLGSNTGLSGDEYYNAAAGIKNSLNDPNAKGKVTTAMAGEGGSDVVKALDTLRTSGFAQLSEQALEATKTMGGFKEALQALVDMNKDLEEFGAKGGEGKFATAAADSAKSFGEHTVLFNEAVGKFNDKIDAMMDAVGLTARPDPSPTPSAVPRDLGRKRMGEL